MPLPSWMKGHPGAPQPKPTHPEWMASHLSTESDADEPVGIKPCTCRGEGCTTCNGDGAIYP